MIHARGCDEGTRYMRACFRAHDWMGLLLRSRHSGEAVQRVCPRRWLCSVEVQEWLGERNSGGDSVYVSVNALAAGARSRTRRDVAAVRHLFLDVDDDALTVLREIERRSEIPAPSHVVHTSPNRAHVLWRVREFEVSVAECVQKRLAIALGGDRAATSVAQLTRLPGFWNHKHDEPYMVRVDYRDTERVYLPRDFPSADDVESVQPEPVVITRFGFGGRSPSERARVYLGRVPPALAGDHGDLHTFQICCRIVRGFALDDDQALAVLAEWNARCQPPWTERELLQKIRSARHNGREPFGGLL